MTSVCPSGHDSASADYCDVCGLPIGEQAAASVPAVPPADVAATAPAPGTATCPHCAAGNPPNALFCEACGYDFTTGTLPRPAVPDLSSGAPASAGQAPAPAAAAPVAAAPVAPALDEAWVAEVWIDPDWYADQESSDPLPSAGLPQVIRLATKSVLVGRASVSRGINPDIDLSSDTGISRRHCQLTTDGVRWWVEDLGSSNGTYVGSAVGTLPNQPLAVGAKREIASDERVYLGAWTRIVIRKAQPGEIV